jgi:adhesin HecA-like repeat protein
MKMDGKQFDALTSMVGSLRSRRGTLASLGSLVLLTATGGGAGVLAARQQHRKTHHHRTGDDHQLHATGKKNKKKKKCVAAGQAPSKKRKTCCAGLTQDASGVCNSAAPGAPATPACTPTTCPANACGTVPDGCGDTLSCGGCAGNTLCVIGTCQPCDVCPSGCLFSTIDQAMAAANSGETIRVCPGVYAGSIVIEKNLTLIGAGDGNGAGNTILQATGSSSAITIPDGRTVSVQHLRITGGTLVNGGGGITNDGALTLTGCTVSSNSGSAGGGIFSSSALTLNGCVVSGNTGNDGGGVFNQGSLELVNSEISGNTAGGIGGGIANLGGSVKLDSASRVVGNQANANDPDIGGGIFTRFSDVVLSSADNVTGNTPDNCGGSPVELCVG